MFAPSHTPESKTHFASSSAKPAPFFQPKLTVNTPGDAHEQEADAVADQVMRMKTGDQPIVQRLPFTPVSDVQRACAACKHEKEMEGVQRKEGGSGDAGGKAAPAAVTDVLSSGGGQSMDGGTRQFMESRFGQDFSQVRIHTDSKAAESASAIQARAYTSGRDIVFGKGEYQPENEGGKRLLAHELVHVGQQANSVGSVQRLSAADCSNDCEKSDGHTEKGKFKLIAMVDKEADFLTIPFKKENGAKSWPVGHSWIKLIHSSGEYWTYGFWPEEGFDSSEPFKDVKGCVHHPDTAHSSSNSQEFDLTEAEFNTAKQKAIDICNNKPNYNLYSNQCTSFVGDVLDSIGKRPIGGFGVVWDSPNALNSWMGSSQKSVGMDYDFHVPKLGTSPLGGGASLTGSYTHQFYSLLGNKLRLQWMTQGKASFDDKRSNYLSTNFQVEFKPQSMVYLPSIYLYGGASAGLISPLSNTSKWGVGPDAGAGFRFNVQDIFMVGFEYSVIKNVVTGDPALNSMALKIGLTFQ